MNIIFKTILTCLITSVLFSQQKPNIIYIYADDLGYGELGCYGQKVIKTPNIDKLASEGIKFTQHYAGAPVCAPSRCMLMTGKNAGHAYIRGNYEFGDFTDENEKGQLPLEAKAFTVAELLKLKGYTTALVGKWGLGYNETEGMPTKQGFDYFYGYFDQKQSHNFYPSHLWESFSDDYLKLNNNNIESGNSLSVKGYTVKDDLGQPYIYVHSKALDPKTATPADFDAFKGKVYAPEKMTEKAIGFIDKNKEKPFFLYLAYTLPHVSLQAPEEWIKKYKGQFDEQPYYGNNGYAPTLYPKSTYAAMVSYLDAQVGIILEKIKALGLDNNTIVMFSSDNGATFKTGGFDPAYFNSMGGLRGTKGDLYEGGIRIPLIAKWPGKIPAGKTSDLISSQIDFFATIADLNGQKKTDTDGISFLPELTGKSKNQKKHEYLYFEFSEKTGQVAVRLGDWKGVKSNMKKNKNAPWEIYNLKTDEKESVDLASQHPELVKKFEEIVKKEHTPAQIKEWEFIN
ncbi:arylsulfatase [Flavobacterium saccharophilum]|uniref:Arylsulfatase A n=1 Tax=Flavobacterium saccharophilum TaxID=29534 RepID=A0A1M7L716_9FLAO|nr:arylsulfatase [Flavobacterium saccharophilum]SHM73864.1 Arylsulfatase A [Flavobacterium saccharophilum]